VTADDPTRDELADIGFEDDDEIDIGRAALLLAALDRQGVVLQPYYDHLTEIADEVAASLPAGGADNIARRAAALADVIGDAMGYEGDTATYEDPRNANLISVIDRRKGLPVALGILYIHAARAQGWSASGLNFPGHFLVRVDSGAHRAILDPFHGGREMTAADMRDTLKAITGADAELRPEHYAPVSQRDVLIRLLNNIKLRAAQMDDPARALKIVDRILLIAPAHYDMLREAGLFHARMGNLNRAQDSLTAYIDRCPDAARKAEGEKLLAQLRTQLN
jgi:regulator of sirC expression with transglutaminase-like and TPR domain